MYQPAGWSVHEKEEVFLGDPDGEPFVVQVVDSGSITISILIYAKDEEDAKSRVIHGCEQYLKRSKKKYDAHIAKKADNYRWEQDLEYVDRDFSRAKSAIALIEKGWIFSMPFDKRYLARIPWAGNDCFL